MTCYLPIDVRHAAAMLREARIAFLLSASLCVVCTKTEKNTEIETETDVTWYKYVLRWVQWWLLTFITETDGSAQLLCAGCITQLSCPRASVRRWVRFHFYISTERIKVFLGRPGGLMFYRCSFWHPNSNLLEAERRPVTGSILGRFNHTFCPHFP